MFFRDIRAETSHTGNRILIILITIYVLEVSNLNPKSLLWLLLTLGRLISLIRLFKSNEIQRAPRVGGKMKPHCFQDTLSATHLHSWQLGVNMFDWIKSGGLFTTANQSMVGNPKIYI